MGEIITSEKKLVDGQTVEVVSKNNRNQRIQATVQNGKIVVDGRSETLNQLWQNGYYLAK